MDIHRQFQVLGHKWNSGVHLNLDVRKNIIEKDNIVYILYIHLGNEQAEMKTRLSMNA